MRDIMRNFEQSIAKAGLPPPPKLSELFSPRKASVSTKDEDKHIYGGYWRILQHGAKGPAIEGGSKRGTVEIKQPQPKWTVAEPLQIPPEAKKPGYSGMNLELKPAKGIAWHETINPAHNVIVK